LICRQIWRTLLIVHFYILVFNYIWFLRIKVIINNLFKSFSAEIMQKGKITWIFRHRTIMQNNWKQVWQMPIDLAKYWNINIYSSDIIPKGGFTWVESRAGWNKFTKRFCRTPKKPKMGRGFTHESSEKNSSLAYLGVKP